MALFLTGTAVTKFQGELPQRGRYIYTPEEFAILTEVSVYIG